MSRGALTMRDLLTGAGLPKPGPLDHLVERIGVLALDAIDAHLRTLNAGPDEQGRIARALYRRLLAEANAAPLAETLRGAGENDAENRLAGLLFASARERGCAHAACVLPALLASWPDAPAGALAWAEATIESELSGARGDGGQALAGEFARATRSPKRSPGLERLCRALLERALRRIHDTTPAELVIEHLGELGPPSAAAEIPEPSACEVLACACESFARRQAERLRTKQALLPASWMPSEISRVWCRRISEGIADLLCERYGGPRDAARHFLECEIDLDDAARDALAARAERKQLAEAVRRSLGDGATLAHQLRNLLGASGP